MAHFPRLPIGAPALAAAVLMASSALALPARAQVQVQALAPPDRFSTPAADTGLPADLWKDTAPLIAQDVIPRLAAKPLSPASAALARRVLATGANGPDGVGNDPELGAARALALIALGEAAGAGAILDRDPGLADSAALSLAASEAALITRADDRACAVGDGLTVDRGGSYWLRLRAFCQARAGQTDAAQLTFSLVQQQSKDADYARLMGAVLAGTPAGSANLRNGVNYALSRQLGLDIQAAAATASPAPPPVPTPRRHPPPARRRAAPAPPPPRRPTWPSCARPRGWRPSSTPRVTPPPRSGPWPRPRPPCRIRCCSPAPPWRPETWRPPGPCATA